MDGEDPNKTESFNGFFETLAYTVILHPLCRTA